MSLHRVFHKSLSAALVASCVLLPQLGGADDLDIYTNQSVLPQQQPLTFLALDLNVSNPETVVCDNVLLSNTANCGRIRDSISLNTLLALLGIPPALPGVPALPGAPVLPVIDPNVPLSDLNGAAMLLVGSYLQTITAFAQGLPGLPPIDRTDPTNITAQETYLLGIINLVTAFATSRAQLSILLNHDDIAGVVRDPITMQVDGTTPASGCAFQDSSSLGGKRGDTTGCSNGAYVFSGLIDPLNTNQLSALLLRLVGALLPPLPALDPSNPSPPATPTAPSPQPPSGLSAEHPYQAKEIYAELASYLRGDPVFNGHLGYYDYGDRTASNNLNQTTPPLAWDTSVETNNSYRSALAANPKACTINLVHVQNTNAARQEESNAALATLFPFADTDASRSVTVPELAATAATDGLAFGNGDRRLINSLFVVQETLSDAATLTQRGESVVTFTDTLNLLGRGQGIAAALVKTLAVDTSIGSITTAASRNEKSGTTDAAYLSVFRPEKNQKPAWVGNLKKLKLLPRGKSFVVVDARAGATESAIAEDGRIRNSALTFWTDAAKLGTGVASDGRKADLGGAGQNIPGYRVGGGGNPGRGGSGSARTVYYDRSVAGATASLAILNAEDSGVRSELLAATGATAVTLPDANCATNCTTAREERDTLCRDPNYATQICSDENANCLSNCVNADYNNVCNVEQSACNAACPTTLGLSRTVCLTACGTQRTACPTTKVALCPQTCSPALLLCPLDKQAACLADSAAQQASCRVACNTTRSADTVVRELLLYARGYDVGTRNAPNGSGPPSSPTNSGIGSRPWMMGAVLHSKPVAINYGRRNGANNPEDIRVVFGSADGMLHMVNDSDGVENWGFMPQAVMGELATLRDNQSGAALPYGVDGSPVVLIRDRTGNVRNSAGDGVITVSGDDGDRVLLFFGLRRGGGAYYALDVTDPDQPRLQWRLSSEGLRRGNGNGSGGGTTVVANSAAQFADLALTFSTPQVARIRRDVSGDVTMNNDDVETTSVLIFGGGYHGGRSGGTRIGKDLNNTRALTPVSQVGQADDRGNALYMIDAATGELLWRATRGASLGGYTTANRTYSQPLLVDSIASDTTVVDTDNDGFADRLYVGDTGGRLWRGDFANTLPSAWTFGPVASVGRHNSATPTVADDRRIFAAPDYVPLRGAGNTGLDLVLFGTGDREDILNLTTPNWLYGLIDRDLVSGKAATEVTSTEDDEDLVQHTDFDDVSDTPLANLDGAITGYRLRLNRNGEKMFSAPVTLNGNVTFSTYVPPDPSNPDTPICVPSEGGSRLYSIGAKTGKRLNIATLTDRNLLAKPGLPGEIGVLAGTAQSVNGDVYSIDAKETYRASWRERLGETHK